MYIYIHTFLHESTQKHIVNSGEMKKERNILDLSYSVDLQLLSKFYTLLVPTKTD